MRTLNLQPDFRRIGCVLGGLLSFALLLSSSNCDVWAEEPEADAILPADAAFIALPVPDNDIEQPLLLGAGCFDNGLLIPESTDALDETIVREFEGIFPACRVDNETIVQVEIDHTVEFTHVGVVNMLATEDFNSQAELHRFRSALVDRPAAAGGAIISWDRPMFAGFLLDFASRHRSFPPDGETARWRFRLRCA